MLGGFLGMMRRVHVVTVRQMGMMGCRLVIAGLMMLGSFPVMVGRMLMVLGGLSVMMRSFLRHSDFLSLEGFQKASWNLGALSEVHVATALQRRELMVNRARGNRLINRDSSHSNFQRVTPLGNCFSGIANTTVGRTTHTGPCFGSSSQLYFVL